MISPAFDLTCTCISCSRQACRDNPNHDMYFALLSDILGPRILIWMAEHLAHVQNRHRHLRLIASLCPVTCRSQGNIYYQCINSISLPPLGFSEPACCFASCFHRYAGFTDSSPFFSMHLSSHARRLQVPVGFPMGIIDSRSANSLFAVDRRVDLTLCHLV